MDIVLFIACMTAFACIGVCGALLYRGWELSRENVPEHVRIDDTVRIYTEHAEDSIDRVLKNVKRCGTQVWQSQLIPFGARVKKCIIAGTEKFAPTAYLTRVYKAIRGLHATRGEEEDKSLFLQEVNAHKSTSTAGDSSLNTQKQPLDIENTKTPM
jgi:hypothetical protein